MRWKRRTAVAVVVLLFVACSDDSKPASKGSTSSGSPSSSSGIVVDNSGSRPIEVLVSNDDGVGAPGIDALVRALVNEPYVHVTVVAPSGDRSGSGGSTTPTPVTAHDATTASGQVATAVDGFPADAVMYALTSVLHGRPDVVISGANAGQNIGPLIDISGTVGAARAAARQGIPALAVSAGLGDEIDFETAAQLAVEWLREHRNALMTANPTAPTTVSNLNVPSCSIGHVRGVAPVAPDPTATTDRVLAAPDCTSSAAPPADDVAAFHEGFATLSEIALQP